MEPWLQDDDIEMHSTHNEGKYDVTERFLRTLKKEQTHKYMTTVSKNVHNDK